MRLLPLALLLAACAPSPRLLPPDDAGSGVDGTATGDQGEDASVEAGAETGVEPADAGAPCIPACGAGQRCEGGRCAAFDAGVDAGVTLTRDAIATLFRTCEPVGSDCAPGVRCAPGFTPAGTRGICTLSCAGDEDCSRRTGTDAFCAGDSDRWCYLHCAADGGTCDEGRNGRCRVYVANIAVCVP